MPDKPEISISPSNVPLDKPVRLERPRAFFFDHIIPPNFTCLLTNEHNFAHINSTKTIFDEGAASGR